MAELIAGTTGQDIYPFVLERIRLAGRQQESRNGTVLNLDDVVIALESPLQALPLGTGRNLNKKIAVAEALQLIGGFSDPEWLCNIAPQFKRFREDIGFNAAVKTPWFHGAYGMRISSCNQLQVAVSRLREETPSRQAVVTLWDSMMDTEPNHLDYPCTVALGFSIRDLDYLDMRVTMRSNDAWLGLPYDLFQFTQMQLSLCNILDLLPGTYTHTAWSLHLYLTDLEASYAVTQPCVESGLQPLGLGFNGQSVDVLRTRAFDIHNGHTPEHVTSAERWYLDVLAA